MDARKKRVCVTFGSGGHTGEMLEMLRMLDLTDVQEIIAVVFDDDIQTCKKIKNCEPKMQNETITFNLVSIPRPRSVGSSIFTSVPRIIWSIIATFYRLSFVLTNGPSISIPVVLFYFVLNMLLPIKLIFIESITRVTDVSLTAKVIYPFIDLMVVQWDKNQMLRWKKCQHLKVFDWTPI